MLHGSQKHSAHTKAQRFELTIISLMTQLNDTAIIS